MIGKLEMDRQVVSADWKRCLQFGLPQAKGFASGELIGERPGYRFQVTPRDVFPGLTGLNASIVKACFGSNCDAPAVSTVDPAVRDAFWPKTV